jgi:L-threonylcarbamoyladenylate synthase
MLSAEDSERLEMCLMSGGIAVLPTDTVYGIACDPNEELAVTRIYKLKGRPPQRPAAVMFFVLDCALRALPELEDSERAAMRALLPGPVTLLLPNRGRRFPLACGPEQGKLGLRVPRLAGGLTELAGMTRPLLQSSANLSGESEARRLQEVPQALREGADMMLDGGELPGVPSSVVDLSDYAETGRWQLMREGALSAEMIERTLAVVA